MSLVDAGQQLGPVRLDDPKFNGGKPDPVYAQLRREAPVYRYAPGHIWALSPYVDVTAALTLPPVCSSTDARSPDRRRLTSSKRQRAGIRDGRG